MKKTKLMKRMWKRVMAVTLATALVFGGLNLSAPLTVKAAGENLLENGDFEANWDASDWTVNAGGNDSNSTIKADGSYDNATRYFNNWNGLGAEQTFSLSKEVANLEAGSYTATMQFVGNWAEDSGLAFSVGENTKALTDISGSGWQTFEISEITLAEAGSLTVSIAGTVVDGYWFAIDNITLVKNGSDEEEKEAALAALTELITACDALTESEYNATTWSALQTALTAAKAVKEASDSKTQDEITEATTALQDAKDNLWAANVVFLDNIENGISGDWSVVWSGTAAASATEAGNGSTVWNIWSAEAQSITISRTFSNLAAGNYQADFVTAGGLDTVAGNITITEVSDATNSKSADMTIWAYNDYQPATTECITIAEGGAVTITIYADITADGYFKMDNIALLKTEDAAIDAEKVEKLTVLQELITACEALTESEYNATTWSALQTALTAAKAVYDNSADKEITEITDATTALQTAKDSLWAASVIYLADMEAGKPADWTESWSVAAATSVSETVNGNLVWNFWTESAQTVTLEKTLNLSAGNYKASFTTMGEKGSGSISLSAGSSSQSAEMTLDGWEVYNTDTTGYLTLTGDAEVKVTVVLDFQDGGYCKLDDILVESATDAEIEAELAAVKTEKLAALNTLITAGKALEASEYTAETFAPFNEQLTAAETFYNTVSADLTQATVTEIEEMTTALQTVMDALVAATIVEAEIFVNKLELKEDFIKGADVSSYVAEKQSGVVYRDFEGNELDDAGFFELLKDAGLNWVRIRVWNNPYDASGNGYGGGNNDVEKAKTIGKLATDAGLKVLIDFHYSDFWADPAAQDAPKAWEALSTDEKATKVYDYTLESLTALHEAGVDVRMVQIGNETNNGICGESTSDWAGMAKIFNAGSSAVRAYEEAVFGADTENGSEVRVAVHFTEPNTGIQASIASKLDSNGVDYDVFATSYYPFWHGTLENLQTVLSDIASTYEKEVMVAETSYAYTFEDGDGHENNVRADQTSLALDYNISIQGQADALSSVMKTVNATTNGLGMFYWEPAWIPVQDYDAEASNAAEVLASNMEKWEKYGSGWAASYSAEYDAENAGRYYGGSSWDNQALFDHNGNPHDSLNVFKYVDCGATTTVRLDGLKAASAEVVLGEDFVLPTTVTGVYNDMSTEEIAVTWNADEVAGIKDAGSYVITGEAGGLEAVCNVEVLPTNLLTNGGFEGGLGEGWTINYGDNDSSLIKIDEKDVKRGDKALKFDAWSQTITGVTLTQTVTDLPAGIYSCFMNVEGAGETDSYTISISAKGDEEAGTDTSELLGWMVWDKSQVDNIELKKGGSITVTISITTTALETWGTIDEVYLYLVEELEAEPDDGIGDDTDTEEKPGEGDDSDTEEKPGEGDGSDTDEEPGEVKDSVSSEDFDIVMGGVASDVVKTIEYRVTAGEAFGVDAIKAIFSGIESNTEEGKEGKIFSFAFTDAVDKSLKYKWTFDGNKDIDHTKLTDPTDPAKSINFDIEVGKGVKEVIDAVEEMAPEASKIDVHFEHSGDLPGTARVTVNVGEGTFASVPKLYLYYYNPETGALELVDSEVTLVDGYATFDITHCSDYVLVSELLKAGETDDDDDDDDSDDTNVNTTESYYKAPKTGDAGVMVYVLVALVSVAAIVFCRKKVK